MIIIVKLFTDLNGVMSIPFLLRLDQDAIPALLLSLEGVVEPLCILYVAHTVVINSILTYCHIIFLFFRFRRLSTAILEANPDSAEGSASDDKNGTEGDIELAVFKVSEKDTVAFAKPHVCIFYMYLQSVPHRGR